MSFLLDRFRHITIADFEFIPQGNGNVQPICLVARELRSNRKIKLWYTEFEDRPPYDIGPGSLFVSYQTSAEASCHLALGWAKPQCILDLYSEYRWLINGQTKKPTPTSLLRALVDFGIVAITKEEKAAKRDLVLRGGPWSSEERQEILDYCESDVDETAELFRKMLPLLDLPRATLRGRYMYSLAWIERVGVPFDEPLRDRLREEMSRIKHELIAEVDRDYGVYEGASFNTNKFVEYLTREGIEWPVLKSGTLRLDDEAFEERARVYPQLLKLRYLRGILSKTRLLDFPVGSDGCNRAYMNPFWTITGRNMPSPAQSILGAPSWLRGLVKPAPGETFAVLDWVAQEFGIAAVLCGDPNMIRAYESPDIYLWFAMEVGDAPPGATKETHEELRERYKPCILGTQYEIHDQTLAGQLGQPQTVARRLLRLHREIFPRYWEWLEDVKNHAFIHTFQFTTFGWRKRITDASCNARAAGNYHSQGNAGDMLRLAAIFATEAGLPVCGLMHDAMAVVAPAAEIETVVAALQACMEKASAMVLDGYKLRIEPTIVRYPDRYMKKKGKPMWDEIMRRL